VNVITTGAVSIFSDCGPLVAGLQARLGAGALEVHRARAERERYSHRATFEEIEANGFNLNIPRYVNTFEPEPEVDLQAVQNEIRDLESQLAQTRKKMNFYLKELGIDV
jgi:type I restriction enzyme M protein